MRISETMTKEEKEAIFARARELRHAYVPYRFITVKGNKVAVIHGKIGSVQHKLFYNEITSRFQEVTAA